MLYYGDWIRSKFKSSKGYDFKKRKCTWPRGETRFENDKCSNVGNTSAHTQYSISSLTKSVGENNEWELENNYMYIVPKIELTSQMNIPVQFPLGHWH